jgi:predicted Ser/Thr protein kinase
MYVDEVIVSHTNENEYNAFVTNKKNEALKDRMILKMRPALQHQLMEIDQLTGCKRISSFDS